MKKSMTKLKLGLLITVVVFVILVVSFFGFAIMQPRWAHQECYASGGKWSGFPDSCADNCGAQACSEAFTDGCDCGPNQCWDGFACRDDKPRSAAVNENATPADLKDCKENNDCAIVRAGCCNCNNGGAATAINRKYVAYWENATDNNCQGTGCLTYISDHWSCFAKPKCVSGKCELQ